MKTLRAGCSKAQPKFFTADPLPGGAGRPRFNQLEMVTTFTYQPSLVKINVRNNVVTDPPHTHIHTHTPTNRQDRLQYTAPHLTRNVIHLSNV